MSASLDDLERHVIVLILYHSDSAVIEKVLETEAADLDEDTVCLCTQASLKARQVRRNVMEIRSRHCQTLQDDEEPKPWDWFTGPFIKRCLLLLRLSPMCAPEKAPAPSDSSSQSLSTFRGAAARLRKSQSEGAASLSKMFPLQKSVSDASWDMTLLTLHSHHVHRRLQLHERSADKTLENIKALTVFLVDVDADADAISAELDKMQAKADYHKPLYTAVAHELLGPNTSLELKLQWAKCTWQAASRITDSVEHRPPPVDCSDASEDVQSWFQSRLLSRVPRSVRLECSCGSDSSGPAKMRLYARCIWSGGASEWLAISRLPRRGLSLEVSMEKLDENARTPLQVELGFVVGRGGKIKIQDARLVIEVTAKRIAETIWCEDRDFKPTSNLLLSRLGELMPHDESAVKLLTVLLSGAHAEDGSFLASSLIFENLRRAVRGQVVDAKTIANLALSFLLHAEAWKGDGVNPLFAKYTHEVFCLAVQQLVTEFPSASSDTAKKRKHISAALTTIARALTSMGSGSVPLVSGVFMDTIWDVLVLIDLDAPRVAMLTWCKMLMTSPEVSEAVISSLAIKLHWLVIWCSPERKIFLSGPQESGLSPRFKPSVAVRAGAAHCLRALAAQTHPGALLNDSLSREMGQQDHDSRDLAFVLSLAGTLDIVSAPKHVSLPALRASVLCAETRAKLLEICKKTLRRRLFWEVDDAPVTRESLRALVFAVRALHALKQLVAADLQGAGPGKHGSTLAAEVYGDADLMRRLAELATMKRGSIPSTRSLEEIIAKDYAVLEGARMVLEMDGLMASQLVAQEPDRTSLTAIAGAAGDVMPLQELESKFQALVGTDRFKGHSQRVQRQKPDAKEQPKQKVSKGQVWDTTGNAFALACDLEKELLGFCSGLMLIQGMEYDLTALPAVPAMRGVWDHLSASTLVTVLARHFEDAQSPDTRAIFRAGPCAKQDLLMPVQAWIRGKMASKEASALDELSIECLMAFEQYAAVRTAALRRTLPCGTGDDRISCAAVVWQEDSGAQAKTFRLTEFSTVAGASDFVVEKWAQKCLARMYVLTREDSIWRVDEARLGDSCLDLARFGDLLCTSADNEQSPDALDAWIQSNLISCELTQLQWIAPKSTDSRGSVELTGSTVTYMAVDSVDTRLPSCNVLSGKAITHGRHVFEFVMHAIGGAVSCGVTCQKEIAGYEKNPRNEEHSWMYFCGRDADEVGLCLAGVGLSPERIQDGDTIGLVVDFSSRSLEFLKNGKVQGDCLIPEHVKELYLATCFDRAGGQVEVRASGVAQEVQRLLAKDSNKWGSNPKRDPEWLKKLQSEMSSGPEAICQTPRGIGLALVLAESMQQTGGFTGSQISRVLEAMATCVFLSADADSNFTPDKQLARLEVGMKVRLTDNYLSIPGSEARRGPLRPGDVGILVADDRSSNPYHVQASNGTTHWYEVGTIEEAKDKAGTEHETEDKLLACIKAMMLSECASGSIEPGPYLGKFLGLMRSTQLKAALSESCDSSLDFVIAFDRRQQPEGNLEELLKPWIDQESFPSSSSPTSPSAAAAGGEQDETNVPETPPALSHRELIAGLQGQYLCAEGSRIRIAPVQGRVAFVWEDMERYVEWELEPERVGDNLYSTVGLNVSASCPFHEEGHVFLILEWSGLSASKLHGPSGEIYERDKTSAGDTPKSLAIEHVSNVLKFQMALDALKTRKPFPAWLIETAKEEEVKRAAKALEIRKARAAKAAALEKMYQNFTIEGASRYNSAYYCNVSISFMKGKTPDMSIVKVQYEIRGDNSLGALQDPEDSRLSVDNRILRPVRTRRDRESPTQIVGQLEYEANISVGSRVDFTFGSGGYSSVGARCAEKVMKNDEGNQVSLGDDSFPGHIGSDKYYCGQRRQIPGSDGQCGPTAGPQCASCLRYQNAHSGDAGRPLAEAAAAADDPQPEAEAAAGTGGQATDKQASEQARDAAPSSADWALAADNAQWDPAMDHILGKCIARSAQEAAPTGERLKVGMRVRLTRDYLSIPGEASGGPLRPGDIGILIADDHSNMPYHVEFDGQRHWFVSFLCAFCSSKECARACFRCLVCSALPVGGARVWMLMC